MIGLEEIECFKKILVNTIQNSVGQCTVYLFGSRAQGTNTPRSDIDLAVTTGHELALGTIEIIKEKIDDLNIPLCVDVVDLNAVSSVMKQQILKNGIIWNQSITKKIN